MRITFAKLLPGKEKEIELPEWLIGTVSKTVVSLRVPRVRIPDSPPLK